MCATRRGRFVGALALVAWSCVVPGVGPDRAEAPEPPDWLAEAERSISAREYEATDVGRGLQAPNREHGLRTYFEPEGARVVDREDATEIAGLRTVSVGGREAAPGEVVSDGARVEIRRPGFVEWFVNSPAGLEQGWTVLGPRASRPHAVRDHNDEGAGPHAGGTPAVPGLSIEVAFDAPVRVDGDRALVGRLEYAGLAAWDAHGAPLPARMEAAGQDRVRILVQDEGAAYPVTIDPTLSSPAFATLDGGQAEARFGYQVAGAGDVNGDGYADVIVGAIFYDAGQTDEGAAFVFHGSANGIAAGSPAAAAARLESNQSLSYFGATVAGAGDVNNDGYDDVVVGAQLYDAGQTDEGAAFVFHGGPSGVGNQNPATAAATLQSDQANAYMGVSIAGAGDVNDDGYADILVPASYYDAGQGDEGIVCIFLGGPSGVGNGTPVSADGVLQGDQQAAYFGTSVASAGDTNGDGYSDVIVGSYLHDVGQTDEGAAFIFLGGPAGIPSASSAAAATLLDSNQGSSQFGISVAGAGDTNGDGFDDVIVGAELYDAGETDEGAAFIFHGSASGVASGGVATASATLQTDQVGGHMGLSVASAGDVNGDGYADVLAGSVLMDLGQTDEGVVSLHLGGPSGVVSGPAHIGSAVLQQNKASARLGVSVAGAGDVNDDGYDDIVVSAPLAATTAANVGTAYVYLGSARGLHGFPGPDSVTRSGQVASSYGNSVARAGDVNGDGFDDVVVGAYLFDAGQDNEGAAFVFHGGPNGIPTGDPSAAATFLQGDQAVAQFGYSVAGAGDVNGDGFADIVVGAYAYDAGQTDEGAAFVYHGGPSGIADGSPATASAVIESNQAAATLGIDVAGAGDVNNDGYDDIVVGSYTYDSGQNDEGAVFAFHGGPNGVGNGSPANADAFLQQNATETLFGGRVAGAGDVNNDGYDDIVTRRGISGQFTVYVYMGGFAGLGSTAATEIGTGQMFANLGVDFDGAGDVNNDGYADIVVGASTYDGDQGNEGAAFIFHGGPTGIPSGAAASVATTAIYSDQLDGRLGAKVAGAGDVDGDGYADIVVGADFYDSPFRKTAFVFLGGPTGVVATSPLAAAATMTAPSVVQLDVDGAGDTNGDGFDDVVVGFPQYTGSITNEGGAFVYHLMRPEIAAAGTDTVGIYIGSSGSWFLRNQNAPGGADVVFGFGPGGLGWTALSGDWDGDGDDTPGLYDPSNGFFFLRNANSPGPADTFFGFGPGGLGWKPIAGDWDGDGDDTIGLYDPGSGFFYIRNANAPGGADSFFGFGPGALGWVPVVGDWDGDGDTTVGLYDPSSGFFYLRNANAPGGADTFFGFGPGGLGWKPVTGDWDGDGDDTIGLYDPSSGFFYLRNANAPGGADTFFGYGPPNVTPLVGDWDGQ
jgi:hypothetical protein